MHRLFVAIEIPEIVADALSVLQFGLEGARWRPAENSHLTLAFIGEVDRHGFNEAMIALANVTAPAFEMRLSGVGYFGDKKPHALWAGVEANSALDHLQQKVDTALRRSGFTLEKRKFKPHVTLAYLRGASEADVMTYCASHGLFSCGPFPVEEFHLYSSKLGNEASAYAIEATYSLSSSR